MLKMILIAPRSGLPFVDKEVEALLRLNFRIYPIMGDIAKETLIKELAGTEADILWVASHISDSGQLILGETSIPFEQFVTLIRSRFKLVYLNTCASQTFAQKIQNDSGCSVICTINNVDDYIAYQTGTLFAQKLAETGSITKAYRASIPAENSTYVYLGGLNSVNMFDSDNQSKELQELTRAFYKLDATLNAELIIMKQRLTLLEENNKHLSQLVAVLQEKSPRFNGLFMVFATLAVVETLFLFYTLFSTG
jgi:hypothetical protein